MPFSPRTLPFCHLVAQIYTYSTCQQHARSPRLYFTLTLRGQSRKTTCAESVAASPHYYDGFLSRPVLALLLLLLRHKIAPPSVPRRLIMPVSSHESQVGNDHRSQYSGTVYSNSRSAGSCRSFYAVVTSEPLQCSATCPCVITVDIGGRGEMLRRALRADWCRLHRER
jgi:hypothetical protein